MHAKATLLLVGLLTIATSTTAEAQGRAESPFAASAASAVDRSSNKPPQVAMPQGTSPAQATPPQSGASAAVTSTQTAPVAVGKMSTPLLAGAPTIAQLSSIQQAALQADARKKAAELYAVPEAASAPAQPAIRRIDSFSSSAPKADPATLRVSAIVGRQGEEAVEIRDAAGRVAVYTTGMRVGDWSVEEVLHDAVVLRNQGGTKRAGAVRNRKEAKPVEPSVRVVPLGGEFSGSNS